MPSTEARANPLAVAPDIEATLRRSYEAFNRKDVDAVLAEMHPDVDWPDMLAHRRVVGHEAVRAYWLDQFTLIDPNVEPQAFREGEGGDVIVDVHQVVRLASTGEVQADAMVQHVYTFRDGKALAMDVHSADGEVTSAPRLDRLA